MCAKHTSSTWETSIIQFEPINPIESTYLKRRVEQEETLFVTVIV
jgi:hypothetical protein